MTEVLPEVTPLPGSAAASVVWRRHGQLYVTVIVKASFAFAPDGEMTEAEPQEIVRAEVHYGNSPARSVRFTSDLSPYLASADVLFTGHAYAPPPPEGPVHHLPVRLALHGAGGAILDKALIAQDKRGFQRLPLVYERAFTGLDLRDNPFGVEADAAAVVDPVDPSRPAGFGPISRSWHARKRLLGATPRKALEGPIVEIPEPFDWAYFQAAPADQRVDYLDGDEWILLEGLHPTSPRVWTRLPGARASARIYGLSAFGVREGQPLELHADTLHIDGDEERCTVAWRRSFSVSDEAALAAARIVAGMERAGAATEWPEPPARRQVVAAAPVAPIGPTSGTGTVVMGHADPTDGAPTAKMRLASMGGTAQPVHAAIDEPSTDEMTFVEPDPEEDEDRTQRTVLPFVPAVEESLEISCEPSASELLMGTLVLGPQDDAAAGSKPVLPFGSPAAQVHHGSASDPTPAAEPPPSRPLMATLSEMNDVVVKAPLPFLPTSLSPVAARSPAPAIPGAPWSASASASALASASPSASPSPSPEIAPLVPAPQNNFATLVLSEAPGDGGSPRKPLAPDEGVSIEKLAAIAAELAEHSAPRGEVLAIHGLSDARWTEAEKRWTEALAEEAKRGERTLLDAHDDAFVKAWEAIRGPFEIADYARLTLAVERGDLAETLEAMAVRRTTWMRLKRIFSRRMAASSAFAARVKQALADGRRGGRAAVDASSRRR